MRSHLIVADQDFTDYIVQDSYNVVSEDVYKSWEDGNMLEHRVIVKTKVKGKFKISCNERGLSLSDFLSAWNSAVNNGVVTLGVYVVNEDSFKLLECYYKITSAQHIKSIGGKLYDVLDIEITQR